MPDKPSIKGATLVSAVEDVKKLVDQGELTREEAGRWLEPEDFVLLDRSVMMASWYDVRSYARLTDLLFEVEGKGDPAYLQERGRRAAKRLLESGLYHQMDYLRRAEVRKVKDPKARFEAFGRDLRKIATIAPSMVSFSTWSHRPDPDHRYRYLLEVRDAAPYSDAHCWTTEGFLNGMAPNRGDAKLWAWSRPERDFLVFRMTRDL